MQPTKEPKKPALKPTEWLSHYEGWKKTSLSKTEYCRRHDLVKDNFYYWCHRIEKAQRAKVTPSFIPVITEKPSHVITEKVTVELSLASDIQLQLTLTPKLLFTLIKELRDATAIIR
jgi:hypothetical protein